MDINNVDDLIESIDGLNTDQIPPWAIILMKGIKLLSVQLQSFNSLNERVQNLEDFKTVNETISTKLQVENERLSDLVESLEGKIDDHEQRSRNQCLMFHGIEEIDAEKTDDLVLHIINNELELPDISIDAIQRSHRVGPKIQSQSVRQTRSSQMATNPKMRPIIVRFTNYRDRLKVYKNKKALKGKRIMISENLTKTRYTLYKASMAKFGKGNTWTSEGRVITNINGKYTNIQSMSDLE